MKYILIVYMSRKTNKKTICCNLSFSKVFNSEYGILKWENYSLYHSVSILIIDDRSKDFKVTGQLIPSCKFTYVTYDVNFDFRRHQVGFISIKWVNFNEHRLILCLSFTIFQANTSKVHANEVPATTCV